jgi:hypothetical protein
MSKKNKRQVSGVVTSSQKNEFNPDYSQIKRDLKRIGTLAGTFIIILVVLAFFQDKLLALFIK